MNMVMVIRNIDFVYDGNNAVSSVNVRFDAMDSATNNSLNGYVKITEAEFYANVSDLAAMATLITGKVKTELGCV